MAKPSNADPGLPPAHIMAAFSKQESFAEPKPEGCEPEDIFEPQAPATPPPVAVASPPQIPPVQPVVEEDEAFKELKRLLSGGTGRSTYFTLVSEGLEIDMEYLASSVQVVPPVCIRRFLLAKNTRMRVRPANTLKLIFEGVEHTVTFVGDMHDFEGLLPFKMITFLGEAPPV